MFARSDEIPSLPVENIEEKSKCRGRKGIRMDGQRENSIMIICIYPKYLSPDLQASILLGLRFHSAVSSGQPIFIILLPDCRSSPIRRLLVLKQTKAQLHNEHLTVKQIRRVFDDNLGIICIISP